MTNEIKEGLEGVVAARTRLADRRRREGRLWLAGFSLEELAPNAHFEEMATCCGMASYGLRAVGVISQSAVELVPARGTLNP